MFQSSTEALGFWGAQLHLCSNRKRFCQAARCAYNWSIIDCHGLQSPGNAEPHQNVKHVAADGVGHGHVSQTYRKKKNRIQIEQAMPTPLRRDHIQRSHVAVWSCILCKHSVWLHIIFHTSVREYQCKNKAAEKVTTKSNL